MSRTKPKNPKPKKSISESTDIIPAMLAQTIVSEYTITERTKAENHLVERAEHHFANNSQFRKGVKQRGDDGLNYLESFMRHWLAAYVFPNAEKSEPPFVI